MGGSFLSKRSNQHRDPARAEIPIAFYGPDKSQLIAGFFSNDCAGNIAGIAIDVEL